MEQISFIKAMQEFFTNGRHGKKVDIPEFKALTHEDKVEFREMLIAEGFDVAPLVVSPPAA